MSLKALTIAAAVTTLAAAHHGPRDCAIRDSGSSKCIATYADLAQTPSLRIDAYTLFGARVGVGSRDGRWSATLWGRNVTNKYYWYNVQVGYDTIWRLTGMPATYGVTASFKM